MGGYYDAGDHVKFGLPMAYSVTMLSWGVIEFREEIIRLNQMGHALAAIKWGTDYFIKSHTQPNVLWAQARISSNFNTKNYQFACIILHSCYNIVLVLKILGRGWSL